MLEWQAMGCTSWKLALSKQSVYQGYDVYRYMVAADGRDPTLPILADMDMAIVLQEPD